MGLYSRLLPCPASVGVSGNISQGGEGRKRRRRMERVKEKHSGSII